jgi:glyoxylase-like metal-dependent hydrolase (beta-lactamase superfamily II)
MKLPSVFPRLALAAALSITSLLVQFPASAAAPIHDTQVAGYHRVKLGDFEITALYDGGITFSADWIKTDLPTLQPLAANSLQDAEHIPGSVSGFIVNTGAQLILVDTGTGGVWGGTTMGFLLSNLRKAGYRPEQVDLILITHLHADHVGGIITPQGKALFPNAVVRMGQADSDFWLSDEARAKAPEGGRDFFDVARKAAKPYIAAGRWSPFTGTDELAPGVRPVPIAGHTPGHHGYEFTSKGQTLLVWGDMVHVASVQMPRPDIGVVFDGDGPTAIATRAAVLTRLADGKTLIAGAHLPFPALGHLRKDGNGYAWIPVQFSAKP